MQYVAFEPDIEILGAAVMATVAGFGPFRSIIERLLVSDGLADDERGEVDVDAWFSQQSWLDALQEVGKRFGGHQLRSIGEQIPKTAVFPPNVVDVHTGVQAIDVAYHLNHRKHGQVMFDPETGSMIEGIGHYGYERLGDRRLLSRCHTPYPCEFDFGIVRAMALRFAPGADVGHRDGECRRKGDEACVYEVRW